ncbi:target of rapamycin (TOR) kinase 1 [Trypanosoma cruzi]|nr:target of rapamycin (TOR) kinase 1 [Trypanosoma cruzi]
MPRGGRHAGGADTTPYGTQGRPRSSPDYYYFGNCGVTTVAHRLRAAPPLVRIDVWIENIRITGLKSDVTMWEAQVLRNADSCHATIGRNANRALRITPSWGCSLFTLTGGYL